MDKITILTAALNAESTIKKCITSVQNQEIEVEHIILEGGSSDKTIDTVRRYESSNTKILTYPEVSLYEALNIGIDMASGSIIGILNADDTYYNHDVLSKVIYTLNKTNCASCYGDIIYYDNKNENKIVRYWKAGSYYPGIFKSGWMPPHPAFFARKEIYIRFGSFRNDLGTSADYELMLRFLHIHKISTTYIPEILVKMSTGGISNLSLKNRITANIMDRKAWKVNRLKPYPWTLFLKPLKKTKQWFIKPQDN